MAAVCATEGYAERIAANAGNRDRLMAMDPKRYIAIMKRWRELFVAGAHHPVLGVSEKEMASIKVPTIIIPGNDKLTPRRAASPRTSRSPTACCTSCRSRIRKCR